MRPKLYLGLGVSGAPEHVEGMQGAELIIAVNTDPGAAIFNVAHYGAVADLFDVADELTSLIGEGREAVSAALERWLLSRPCRAGADAGATARPASARSISAVSSATSKSAPTTLTASEYIARSFGQLTRK